MRIPSLAVRAQNVNGSTQARTHRLIPTIHSREQQWRGPDVTPSDPCLVCEPWEGIYCIYLPYFVMTDRISIVSIYHTLSEQTAYLPQFVKTGATDVAIAHRWRPPCPLHHGHVRLSLPWTHKSASGCPLPSSRQHGPPRSTEPTQTRSTPQLAPLATPSQAPALPCTHATATARLSLCHS